MESEAKQCVVPELPGDELPGDELRGDVLTQEQRLSTRDRPLLKMQSGVTETPVLSSEHFTLP